MSSLGQAPADRQRLVARATHHQPHRGPRAGDGADQRPKRLAEDPRQQTVARHPARGGGVSTLLGGGAFQHPACRLVFGRRAALLVDPLAHVVLDRSDRNGKHVRVHSHRDSVRILQQALPRAHDQGVGSIEHPPVEVEHPQHGAPHPLVVQEVAHPHNPSLPVGFHRARHALRLLEGPACAPVTIAVSQLREHLGPLRD